MSPLIYLLKAAKHMLLPKITTNRLPTFEASGCPISLCMSLGDKSSRRSLRGTTEAPPLMPKSDLKSIATVGLHGECGSCIMIIRDWTGAREEMGMHHGLDIGWRLPIYSIGRNWHTSSKIFRDILPKLGNEVRENRYAPLRLSDAVKGVGCIISRTFLPSVAQDTDPNPLHSQSRLG